MRGDGDGWVFSSDGSRHWGRHGAAGLLLRAPASPSGSAVLLQHRAAWSHQGGTWALPGGARDSHESAVHAAVREAGEEAGITADLLTVRDEHVTALEDSGWSYTTVVADASEQLSTVLNGESTELRWVDEHDVDTLPLHPAFATSWPSLRTVPVSVVLAPDVDADVPPSPRTVRLAVGRFGWVVEVHRPVDVLAALRGHDENTVVVTGDGDLASSVPADVIVLPPALF